MPKEGFSCAAMEGTQQQINKPRPEVQEVKKRGVVFPGHKIVKAVVETQPAIVWENQMDGCLSCQIVTAKNPQTCWRRKGTGAHPPRPVPLRPGMPPAPPDYSEQTQSSETEGVPPRYVYLHTPLPSARFVNLDPYAKDRMCDQDFIPDLLTDEGRSTG